MRRSSVILGVLLIQGILSAAAFTTIRSGNWSDTVLGTRPWAALAGSGPGGVPGAGDTITVGLPMTAHTITCDLTPCTYGTDAASGVELSLTAGSGLVIAANKSLTMRGNMKVGDATDKSPLTLNAGSTLTCDTSHAPAATSYTITMGYAYQFPSLFTIAGTSNSRVTVTSNIGSNLPCYFALGQVDALSVDWEYADFSHMFNNSTNGMLAAWSLNGGGATDKAIILNCTFTDSGSITMSGDNVDAAAIINIQNNNWASSKDVYNMRTYYGGSPPTGTRVVSGNVFDQKMNLWYPAGYTFTNNRLFNGLEMYDDVDHLLPTTFSGNFWAQQTSNGTGSFGLNGSGTLTGNYHYVYASVGQDPHFLQVSGTATPLTISNSIFEAGNSTSMPGNEGSVVTDGAGTVTFTGNIITCDATGTYTSGRPVAYLGASSVLATITHNTYCSDNGGKSGVVTGENGTEWAGMLVAVQYNSVWSGGYIAQSIASVHVADTVTAAGADYNNGYLLATGTCTNSGSFSCYGYSLNKFSGSTTPGAHDTILNPYFVSTSQKLLSWDASLGGPGTEAHALAELAKFNLPTFNPLYTVSALISYVTTGHTTQNRALANINSTYVGIPFRPVYAGLVAAGYSQ